MPVTQFGVATPAVEKESETERVSFARTSETEIALHQLCGVDVWLELRSHRNSNYDLIEK